MGYCSPLPAALHADSTGYMNLCENRSCSGGVLTAGFYFQLLGRAGHPYSQAPLIFQ